MQKLILSFLIFFGLTVNAKIEVLFNPHEPTLEKIADWIGSAQNRVDIAMYNMDVTDQSPIIQRLKSSDIQNRIHNGSLSVRLIFEGYGGLKNNNEKLSLMESLGLDARYLGKHVKVHHKIAVIDTGSNLERVITGSANWSLSSYKGYNENILFFENEPESNYRYQTEFDRLWVRSFPFGFERENILSEAKAFNQNDLDIFFNSPRHLKISDGQPDNLTEQIVRAVNSAQSTVEIATTRVRTESILDAIKIAADRGVKIKILINQDDFKDIHLRGKWLLESSNIQLRIKFFNLKPKNYLSYQMHNKFLIVDRKSILTGSFNWSLSSENQHIENLVQISGEKANSLMPKYSKEFEDLWDLGRSKLNQLKEKLAQTKSAGLIPACSFEPISLEVPEVNFLIKEYQNCSFSPRANGL